MNFNEYINFEDLARACGYSTSNNNNNNTNDFDNKGCFDIPYGFQSLNPELFVIIGAILGEIIAGNIPFNVQNSLGNWFTLLGQVIITYNAQQQYFEQGPGSCFNPKNFNINNSNCTTNQNNSDTSTSKQNNKESSSRNNSDRIEKLESQINDLIKEIAKIKNSI